MSNTCPICWEDRELFTTRCGHSFCKECIERCFDTLTRLPWIGKCPVCRRICTLSEDANTVNRLDGSVFVQGSAPFIGVASYHFESNERAYISYSAAPDDWLLSNGTKPPSVKYFDNCQYDPLTRTFRGDIHWDPFTFDYSYMWKYEIHFTDDFNAIASGTITALEVNENVSVDNFGFDQGNVSYFRHRLNVASPWGCCYVRDNPFVGKVGFESYHFVNPRRAFISFARSRQMGMKLDDATPIPFRKYFENITYDVSNRNFKGEIYWRPHSMEGAFRWEFNLNFSPDFSIIESGTCIKHKLDDTFEVHEYGVALKYSRLPIVSS